MRRPEIIFFDAGGTLIMPHPSVGHVYAEVAGDLGVPLDPEATQRAFDQAFSDVRVRILAERPHLFGFDPETARAVWREILAETLDHLGARGDSFDEIFSRVFEEFSHARRYALLEGTREALVELRRRGHRLGLISNWDHRLRPVLSGLGLDRWLDPIVISCEVGAEKPDPEIFRAALGAARVEPERALMVGDSPAPDVSGARAAGLWAVLLDLDGRHGGPHPRIRRLGDLPAWLDENFDP